MNNKRNGFTLVELLVYITIFSLIVLGFSKQMISLINQYTVGKSTTKQQLCAHNTISTLLGEIQNMGLKVYCTSAGQMTAPGVTVSSTDQSSFLHAQGIPGDTLTIYKAELDNADDWTNIVDTIKYYLKDQSLIREFRATGGTVVSGTLAENVYALQFLYGTNLVNTVLFDQSIFTPASWTAVNPTGTAPSRSDGTNDTKLTFSAMAKGTIRYGGSFSVTANEKYLVSLTITPSDGFPQNLDSLNFSFKRIADGTIIASEKFLPQKMGNQLVVFINSTEAVYATIDYCVKGVGSIDIKSVKATCTESGTYVWLNNPSITDKQNIRVVRVQMVTRSDDKTGVKIGGSVVVGDATVQTSDNYTWRLYDDIIETPNNGSLSITGSSYGTTLTDAKIRLTLVSLQY
jgi:prepilin-type N-terminal cleavage/methylation domain-containing protein